MATVGATVSVRANGDGRSRMIRSSATCRELAFVLRGYRSAGRILPAACVPARLRVLASLVLLGLSALPASAETLSNVLISAQDGQVSVETRFTCSFRYDGHEPRGKAQQIEIDLIPVGQCSAFRASEPVLEMRRPTGSEMANLSEVEFNNRGGRTFLVVRFNSPQLFTVSQSAGLRSIRVIIDEPDTAAGSSAGERSVPPPVIPYVSPELQPQPQSSGTARMRVQSAGENDAADGAFVINLLTAKDTPAVTSNAAYVDGKQLYTSMMTVGGVEWHRLRLGFFASEGRAAAALEKLRAEYPDALVVRVAAAEYRVAAANPVKRDVAAEPAANSGVKVAATGLSDGRMAGLMADGRNEMLAQNYPAAIQIYTKVLREGDTRYAAEALEYLGLARERNGQTAHAVAEYRRYLSQYPAGEGQPRVQQRLDGLLMSTSPSSKASSLYAGSERNESRWDVYGGIAQYYRRDVSDYDEQGAQTTQSAILSDVDLLTRRRGERFDVATRMTFGNYYDLLNEDEGTGNDTRFYYLYADMADRDLGLSARLGRQTLHTSGVLGRFDGAHLAWQFNPDWRLNLMGGEPVYSTSNRVESDRSFYGVSVDAFDVADLLDLSFYFNTQEVDGIADREAVGGQLRYYDDRRSLVSMLDYDIGYNVLNSFVALGNWTFDNRLTLNATFDFRRSPYLLTENALVGQNAGTIDELLEMFTEDEVRQLAEDRSGELTTVTLGFSRPLYERFQINADVTMSDFSGTPESTNVPEFAGTGAEYYYNLSLIGSSLMKEGDTSIFSLRYLDGSTVTTTSFSADTRFPVTDRFRINPRLLVSYRDFNTTDSSEVLAIPALRLFYQFRRRTRFEFELGGRWSDREMAADSIGSTSWFLYSGYRTDF